jgi:hypothetical protein
MTDVAFIDGWNLDHDLSTCADDRAASEAPTPAEARNRAVRE